jgi:hypothetical protein
MPAPTDKIGPISRGNLSDYGEAYRRTVDLVCQINEPTIIAPRGLLMTQRGATSGRWPTGATCREAGDVAEATRLDITSQRLTVICAEGISNPWVACGPTRAELALPRACFAAEAVVEGGPELFA